MARISENVLDDIRRIDLSEAIEYYTGEHFRNGKIRCPFHKDRNPSLSVKNGIFRCWSCGASGSLIDFVRMYYNLDFRNAVQKICQDFNIDAEEEPKDEQPLEKAWAEFRKYRRYEIANNIRSRRNAANLLCDLYRRHRNNGSSEEFLNEVEKQIEETMMEIRLLENV